MLSSLFGQTLEEGENRRRIYTGLWMVPYAPAQGRARAALPSRPPHPRTHGRPRHTAVANSTQGHATRSHTVTESSSPTSQARISEEGGESPHHQPGSEEERKKQDRFEAECIENRRENKVGGRVRPAWPQELQDGGWALPLLALRGRRDQRSGVGASLCPGRGLA